jgi:hypothetical protein
VDRYCRPRLNRRRHTFAVFICATGPNGSAAFAQIAGRIPRMRALMNWASAGMHRYPTASCAGGRA